MREYTTAHPADGGSPRAFCVICLQYIHYKNEVWYHIDTGNRYCGTLATSYDDRAPEDDLDNSECKHCSRSLIVQKSLGIWVHEKDGTLPCGTVYPRFDLSKVLLP